MTEPEKTTKDTKPPKNEDGTSFHPLSFGYKPKALLSFANELVSTFNPERVTPSTHCDQWIVDHQIDDNQTITFLQHILFGIDRRNDSVQSICDHYYEKHRRKTEKKDKNLYFIMIYLSIFYQIDLPSKHHLPFKTLKSLILAADHTKMVNIFTFLFQECLRTDFIYNLLSTTFDPQWVSTSIIEPMLNLQPQIKKLLIQISEKNLLRSTSLSDEIDIDFESTKKLKMSKPTESKPFNITKTLPRKQKVPEPIPEQFKSSKVPQAIYKNSIEHIQHQKTKRKQALHRKTVRKYKESKTQRFEFETDKRPTNIHQVRETVEQQIQESMAPISMKQKVPNFNRNCPVRMNTASILREDALFQREQHEQAQLLREYEFGLRDSTEFDEWKEQELLQEELERVRLIQDRKHEMQQSAVFAKKAVEATVVEKYIAAQTMNMESIKMSQEKREHDRLLRAEKHEMAQKVKEGHINAVTAVKEHKAQNKEIRDLVAEQRAENERIKKQRAEQELARKQELIAKIQEMEKRAMEKMKESKELFDPTTSSEVGLLCEMSVNELLAKIVDLREKEEAEKERRRRYILDLKKEKHTRILMKARNLSKIRAQRGSEMKLERAKKVAMQRQIERERMKKHEDTVLVMASDLKKTQKLKLEQALRDKAEIKRVLQRQKEWRKTMKQNEKLNWMNYNDGLERIVRHRQKNAMNAAETEVNMKDKLRAQRRTNLTKQQTAKQSKIQNYDRTLRDAQNVNNGVQKKSTSDKRARNEVMRTMKQEARDSYLETKLYEKHLESERASKRNSLASTRVKS